MNRLILLQSALLAALVAGCATVPQAPTNPQGLTEAFDGTGLAPSRWLIAERNWGGKDPSTGLDYNGGVVAQNVQLSDGTLKLVGHGNLYDGPVKGIARKNNAPRADGRRVGAAIATRDYFASGRYEIRAKVAPQFGACSALWTFHYQEYYPGSAFYQKKEVGGDDYYAVNHEIDIEMPGRPGAAAEGFSFQKALCNTWVGENDSEYTPHYTDLAQTQDDGQFHTYRIDWHTGGPGIVPRVEFWFDGVLTYTSTDHVPTNAGRLWLGLWFPKKWAGTPDFDTTAFEVDSVAITPFHEPNDRFPKESFPNDGWAPGSF